MSSPKEGMRVRASGSLARNIAGVLRTAPHNSTVRSTAQHSAAADNSGGILLAPDELRVMREMTFNRLDRVMRFARQAKTTLGKQLSAEDIDILRRIVGKLR